MSRKDERVKAFSAKHPYVILCEGQDEKWFLVWYIDFLIKKGIISDTIDVRDFGGINELRPYLGTISKIDGFKFVKAILIVRDAEKDAKIASVSITDSVRESLQISLNDDVIFTKAEFGCKVGYVLLPGRNEAGVYRNGTLENLCMDIFDAQGECVLGAAKAYIDGMKNDIKYSTIHKNYLHACLAGTNDYVGLKIGEAARSQAFNFASEKLDFLRQTIIEMIKK